VRILRGEQRGRLHELCAWFAAAAAVELLGLDHADAGRRVDEAIASGAALERFRAMVEAQGGDPRVVDDPDGVLPRAPVRLPIASPAAGTLAAVDAEALGLASAALGAGRRRKGDPIDPSVGIVVTPKIGDRLEAGAPIGEVHAASEDDAHEARSRVLATLVISDTEVEAPALVLEALGDEGRGAEWETSPATGS
jgi:thymidine phosphorylase